MRYSIRNWTWNLLLYLVFEFKLLLCLLPVSCTCCWSGHKSASTMNKWGSNRLIWGRDPQRCSEVASNQLKCRSTAITVAATVAPNSIAINTFPPYLYTFICVCMYVHMYVNLYRLELVSLIKGFIIKFISFMPFLAYRLLTHFTACTQHYNIYLFSIGIRTSSIFGCSCHARLRTHR